LQEILAAARTTVSLVFLIYASWSDYKTREVTNKVWAFYAPIALALTLSELLLYDYSDSKALMCIALALPFFPTSLFTPLLPDGLSPISQLVFPITVLSNSVLIAALSALYLLLRNLARKARSGKPLFEGALAKESFWKKVLVLVTGQKFPIATLKAKWHVYPMEDITEENGVQERKLVVVPKDEGRAEIVERLSTAADAGKIDSRVWATPGLPMLIFVTIGLIMALSLGDIVWFIVARFFG
jgi:archaeal preflagellin peptidase FlaK